jgi:outer membrane protein assembly factor BamB
MGFLKIKILLLLIILLLVSCARSVIKVSSKLDEEPFQMFGRIPEREFYVPITVSDSLELIWESSINGSFPTSSISIYDEFVFANDLSGRVYCYRLEDGKQMGKLKFKGAVYSTPILFKTNVVFPVALEKENFTELVFYDYLNGREIEVIELPGRVLTEMIAIDDEVIFNTEIGAVYRYTMQGKKIWETHTRVPTRSSPALKNNLFIFGNDVGELIALDAASGDSVYVTEIGGQFYSGLTIVDPMIYVGNENGNLYAINYIDGEIIWQFDSGARILMTPSVDDENVFFGNLSGKLFSLNKNDGSLNWEQQFRGVLNSTPLLTENLLVLPDIIFAFHLIDKETGEVRKTIPLDGRAKLSPVYYRNLLFIGYDNGILRAYEFAN